MTLASYLSKTKVNYSEFARQIGVSAEAVRRYSLGMSTPTHKVMTRIVMATNNRVNPNDFFRARVSA
jgi:predicted transcriptional regulator